MDRTFTGRAKRASRPLLAAAVLGLALMTPGDGRPVPPVHQGLERAAAASVPAARSATTQAPQQSSLKVQLGLDRKTYEPADPVRITFTLSNPTGETIIFPAPAVEAALQRTVGKVYEVAYGPAGEVAVPPGRTVKADYELYLNALPHGLSQGKGLTVAFPGTVVTHSGQIIEVPPFEISLKSSLQEKQPPGLIDHGAWEAPFHFYLWTFLAWAAGLTGAYFAWRQAVRGVEALRAWWGKRMTPIPDPGRIVRHQLDVLEQGLEHKMGADELYRTCAILMEYFLAATVGLYGLTRLSGESSLQEASRTLRGLVDALEAEGRIEPDEVIVLRRLQASLEKVLYEEAPVASEVMKTDLDGLRGLIEARLKRHSSLRQSLPGRDGEVGVVINPPGVFPGKLKRAVSVDLTVPGSSVRDARFGSAELVVADARWAARPRKVIYLNSGQPTKVRLIFTSWRAKRALRTGSPFWLVLPSPTKPLQAFFSARVPASRSSPLGLFGAAGMLGLPSILQPGAQWLGVAFAQPLWLLGLLPLAAFSLWALWRSWRPQPRAGGFPAPAEWTAAPASPRQFFSILTKPLRVLALALALVSASGPMWGTRLPATGAEFNRPPKVVDTGLRSVDTGLVIDRSGSMGDGTKLDDAKTAAAELIDRQVRTTNRMAIVAFDDRARVVIHLTRDTDALKAALATIELRGGTKLDVALDAMLSHFLEMGLVDADPAVHPLAAAARETLKSQGLAAAIKIAAQDPALLEALEGKGRDRVVIFLTDGMGGDPSKSVERARLMGVRIFSVAIGYDADKKTLAMMADNTKGKFYQAFDSSSLSEIFKEIDKLKNRTPVPVRVPDVPQPIPHDADFAALAVLAFLLSFAFEMTPASLPGQSRRRRGGGGGAAPAFLAFALAGTMLGAAPPASAQSPLPAQTPQAAARNPAAPRAEGERIDPWKLSPYRPIREVEEARRLYDQGDYRAALDKFAQAAKDYPGSPEIVLDRAMAERRLQHPDAAERSLKEAAGLARSQGRPELIAAVEQQLGHLAVEKGDVQKALGHFRAASQVRGREGFPDQRLETIQDIARKNYETLLRGRTGGGGEGQPQPSDGQGKKDPKEGQQGEDKKPQDPKGQEKKGEGQDGQGQPKPGEKPQDKKPGDKPQDPKPGDKPEGQKPSQQPGEKSDFQKGLDKMRQLLEGDPSEQTQDREGGGAGQGQRRPGRVWAAAPLAVIPFLESLGETLRQWLAWTIGADPAAALTWASPLFLGAAAVAVPVFIFLALRAARKHFLAARALAPAKPKTPLSWPPIRSALRRTAVNLAALVLLSAAAAGPAFFTRDDSVTFGGKDIAFVQDVSLSVMWAEDGRYAAATGGLERFTYWINNENAGDRAVIIPVAYQAGESALTRDHKGLVFQLYHLGQDAVYLDEGSNIANAVNAAELVFRSAKDIGRRDRVLIIMSDGEDTQGTSVERARAIGEWAKRQGFTVYTLGLGTPEGARMKVPEEFRQEVGSDYVQEYSGWPAVTKLNEPYLKELAEASGGSYERVKDARDVERVLYQIAHTEKEKSEGWNTKSAARVFAGPAAVLLALGLFLGRRKGGRRLMSAGAPLLTLPFLGSLTVSGVWPAAAAVLAAALLLAAALVLLWPWGRLEPRPAPQERMAEIRRAAARVRFEKILRGEFKPPDVVPHGADPDDVVPHTNEPWRSVDHRASARTGRTFAKRYEEDPDIPVWLVADLSGSSRLGTSKFTKREVIADSAALLALSAAKEDMPVGLVIFTDRVETVIEPRRGAAHARRLAELLASFEPQGRGTDLARALSETLQRLNKRGVIAVLSDFQTDGGRELLATAGRRHVLVPVLVQDPIEGASPQDLGAVEAQDAEKGDVGVVDTGSILVRNKLAATAQTRRRQVDSALAAAGAAAITLSTTGGHLERFVAHFERGGRP